MMAEKRQNTYEARRNQEYSEIKVDLNSIIPVFLLSMLAGTYIGEQLCRSARYKAKIPHAVLLH
jgi:hypothetical protein